MDILDDILNDLIDQDENPEIEEEPVVNWFDNGIKKVGGSTLRFTEVEEITYDYLKVTRLGSTIDVDFSDLSAGSRLITLFISNSKSKIDMKTESEGDYNVERWYCNDPLYTVYHYYSVDDISGAQTGQVHTNHGTNIKLYKSNYNDMFEQFNTDIEFYDYSYGWMFDTQYYDYSGYIKPTEAYKNMCGLNQSQGNGEQGYYRSSNSGNGIKCAYYNNPATQKIEIRPIMDGFGIASGHGMGLIYETTVLGNVIAEIPYSLLNDLDYFNPEIDKADPWLEDEGDEGGAGGTGTGIRTDSYPSDDIGFPSLPTVNALSSGFITAYNPDNTQMQSLITYLWTSEWVETIKKIFNNPFDAVISLQLLPYSISDISSPATCKIGCINTNIPMDKVTNQFKILDCGSVSIPEGYGNALDYTNVRISIYLPFVGFRQLDTTLCMNSNITLKYYVDLLTGSAVAMLEVSKTNTSKSVFFTYDCNTNMQIPISQADYSFKQKSLEQAAGGILSIASKNILGGLASGLEGAARFNFQVPSVESTGQLTSNAGVMSQFTPYVVVELPVYNPPSTFNHDKGKNANFSAVLSSLSGFTIVDSCHLDGIECTDSEKNEIYKYLKSGVII